MTGTPQLVGLAVHPVKSTAIRPVPDALVTQAGLRHDRRWMVIDGDGALISAREQRRLFTIVADPIDDTEAIRLSAPGLPALEVREPAGAGIPVRLHRHQLYAVPAPAQASAWIRQALGDDQARLVWCDDPSRRSLNPAFSQPGDHTALADGYPVTLASTSSLSQLNDWATEAALERGDPAPNPIAMQRFRPNLVVEGFEPFAEDRWRRIRVGEVVFRVAKGVDRCVMTIIDPADLSTSKEPLRTLAKHRRWDGTTWFASQLIPEVPADETAKIRVGDPIEVLELAEVLARSR